jgi:hypothetical protein
MASLAIATPKNRYAASGTATMGNANAALRSMRMNS